MVTQPDKHDIERKAHFLVEDSAGLEHEEQLEFLRQACATSPPLLEYCLSLLSYQISDESFMGLVFGNAESDDESNSEQHDLVGTVLGNYRIDRRIGSGGTSEVFLAYRNDNIHRHPVALKIIRGWGNGSEAMERMKYERRVLSQFKHPNIASFLDGGSAEDGRPYFVLEYVKGKPITEYCKEKNLSLDARLRLFMDVCSAVYAAHAKLTLHRDIKPSNILVTDEGLPKLLDFGIAKMLDEDKLGATHVTRFLSPMTPQYASPEQVRQEDLSVASDQYSLGILLYELITHVLPNRSGKNYVLDVLNNRNIKLPSVQISESGDIDLIERKYLIKRLRAGLDAIVMKAIHCDVEKRYSSVREFSRDIHRYLKGRSVLAKKEKFWDYSVRIISKNKKSVVFATFTLALFFSVATIQQIKILKERDNALYEREKFEQTKEFLLGLFKLSHPEENVGKDTTVREVLDRGIDVIRIKFKQNPEVKISLLLSMAQAYRDLHLTNKAYEVFREALALQETHGKTNDETMAVTLTSIVELLIKKGGSDQAQEMILQAMDIYSKLDSVEPKNVVYTYIIAGRLANRLADYNQAVRYYKKAAQVLQTHTSTNILDLITIYMELGILYTENGRYEQAQIYNEKALALSLQRSDQDLLSTGIIYNTIAVAHHFQEHYTEALVYYQKAINVRRELLGEQNSRLVIPYNNMGELYSALGNYSEAIVYHEKALQILKANDNTELFYLALTYNELGDALAGLEQYTEALQYIGKSLEIRKRIYGENHQDVATSYDSYGRVYAALEKGTIAQEYFEKSLAIRNSIYGAEHSLTQDVQTNLNELTAMLAP